MVFIREGKKMKTSVLIFAAAVALAMTSIGAHADDETYYATRNGAGYIIYEHYDTYEIFTIRNANNDIISERTHYFKDDVVPVSKPVIAATNPAHAVRTAPTPMVQAPVAAPTQAPVIVYDGKLLIPAATATPTVRQALPKEDDAAAEYRKNIKSGKWKEFKNGE
jgi:hypothetical protein